MTHNPSFPLLDLLPITERAVSGMTAVLAKAQGKTLPVPATCSTHEDLVRAILDNDGGGAPNSAIEDALRASPVYRGWQRAMPYLKDVPAIHGFRTKKRHLNDVNNVHAEILKHGGYLPKGQVVYRGGDYGANLINVCAGPISTSAMPSVARWHAIEVKGSIAILEIAKDLDVRAFAYSGNRNQTHALEFEVLIQNDLCLHRSASFTHAGMDVHRYLVHSGHC